MRMMDSMVERLLYVTLLLVFIGVGIGLFSAIKLEEKINSELSATQNLANRQEAIINQIAVTAEEGRSASRQNTEYLKCLINLQRRSQIVTPDDCASVRPSDIDIDGNTINPTSSPANVNSMETTSPPTSTKSNPSPPPAPPSNPLQDLLKSITGIGL